MTFSILSDPQPLSEASLKSSGLAELKVDQQLSISEDIAGNADFTGIVGQSSALRQVLRLVEMVAASDATVLLLGETGTGKELIARAIHERSRRQKETFLTLNCAAIPSSLFESELFGHERGAFTGAYILKVGRLELADRCTMFLDEVGDRPLEVQPKLWRTLQERKSFGCTSSGISPTSSRNIEPRSANSSRPTFSMYAPVKAPRSCPKSSLSNSELGIAAQLSVRNVSFCRRLRS